MGRVHGITSIMACYWEKKDINDSVATNVSNLDVTEEWTDAYR